MKTTSFSRWLTTFIDEKGIDGQHVLVVPGPSGENHIPLGCLVQAMLQAPAHEQAALKRSLVKIDFCNGDVLHYFRHLARALAV